MKIPKSLFQVLPEHKRIYHRAYHRMFHNIYPNGSAQKIKVEHEEPMNFRDKVAYKSIKLIRRTYDYLTRYDQNNMTIAKWIQRCILLETVAGVPGMVAGMTRHLKSLRDLQRDKGWIHNLLEQADNERFHLFVFLSMKQPSYLQRLFILAMQGGFFGLFSLSYLLNPKFSHRFVGYLEEQAVKTYTIMIQQIDNPNSSLYQWNTIEATAECRDYYRLPESATLRDVIVNIRADEACHRATNHFLASVDQNFEIEEEQVELVNEDKLKDEQGTAKKLYDTIQTQIQREQEKQRHKKWEHRQKPN